MRQMENIISLQVFLLTLGLFTLTSFAQNNPSEDAFLDSNFQYGRRPQDFGLGKRFYTYLTEYKRLPVYNFGLGKRSHLYNFGLGKRSEADEDLEDYEEYDEYPYSEIQVERVPELDIYNDDEDVQSVDKRTKAYSFGLGKRLHRYDFGLGKRGLRYDFGLGKRTQPTVHRDKLYNFGLGKRNRLYSFGLGKRPYNQGPVPTRFNFGLGKRSEGIDSSKNIITKREVHEESVQATTKAEENRMEPTQDPTDESQNQNEPPVELESHELMNHPEKVRQVKRSPYKYSFDGDKNNGYWNAAFSRQFRKPIYDFGLGKRTSSAGDAKQQDFKSLNN